MQCARKVSAVKVLLAVSTRESNTPRFIDAIERAHSFSRRWREGRPREDGQRVEHPDHPGLRAVRGVAPRQPRPAAVPPEAAHRTAQLRKNPTRQG